MVYISVSPVADPPQCRDVYVSEIASDYIVVKFASSFVADADNNLDFSSLHVGNGYSVAGPGM